MKIEKMMMVSIDYTLTDSNGNTLDTSTEKAPLAYIQGTGQIIPGLEEALESRIEGETLKVEIPAKDAYGERNEEYILTVPKADFEGGEIKVDDFVELQGPQGVFQCKVVEFNDENVTLDANHPLAGETLFFDVSIVGVRKATDEEINALSAACGGGSCASEGECCGSHSHGEENDCSGGHCGN